MEQLPEVVPGHRIADAECLGFVGRTAIGAKQKVHQRRDVGVVAGFAFAGVMPMMQLWRADEDSQRTDW